MPLAAPPRRNIEHVHNISELISYHDENKNTVDCFESLAVAHEPLNTEDTLLEEAHIDHSDLWIVKYDELAQKSKNIPLSHLGCCKEGGELFNDLCMWVDINQKYVDLGLFPQWDDIARELDIDDMKTEWVKVCIRPEQSFTRAILEIYMSDGGTLGEVITALRKQKQYRIIQEISEKAEEFMDVYNTYHKNSYNPNSSTNVHLYSILKTLFETFNKVGHEDPLNKFQLYSSGFKSYLKNFSDTKVHPSDTDLIVNAVHINEAASYENHDSGYTSPHRYGGSLPAMSESNLQSKPISEIRDKKPKRVLNEVQEDQPHHTIKILLVFAKDGVTHADHIVTGMINFYHEDFPNIQVDFFRLNEVELWNALLLNPEGCLMKWIDEMEFVMPILTPDYIQDLHNPTIPGPPAPASAMINKYVYTLLRSEFVANGCQNMKVRPAMPKQYLDQLYKCKAVLTDPLLKMWKHTDIPTMRARVGAIIKIWAKKHEILPV